MQKKSKTNRRDFLKTSTIAGAAAVSTLGIARSAYAAGDDQIQIALIGCGGRGQGAIRDRAQVNDNFKIVAVADAFEYGAKEAVNRLRADEKTKDKADIPDDRIFWGLNAYKQAIDALKPGDQVVIATPPGFRPFHYRYAVQKGLHVFMEKPVCIDAPGFQIVMETNKLADEKGLKVQVGFQRRVEKHYYDWIKQIHDGAVGDVLFSRVYWGPGGGIWCKSRNPGESELDFQVRNWYHFVWACGDQIVEQHAHNIDVGNWVHGKGDRMAHPVEANAQGGRTHRAGPMELMREAPPFADRGAWDEWYQKNKGQLQRHGQAWDHTFVEYTYSDGSKMFSQGGHLKNVWHSVSETIHGAKGFGNAGWLKGYDGKDIWKNDGKAAKGPYQWEHDLHVKAIRENKPVEYGCDPYSAAMSCMTAVLGREAAFSGKILKWDELLEKGRSYFPNGELTDFGQTAPVQPDADGFYESSVAVPGVYNPFKS